MDRSELAKEAHKEFVASFPTYEDYKEYIQERGRKGGRARVPKGFKVLGSEAAREAGRKGGSAKRRKVKS